MIYQFDNYDIEYYKQSQHGKMAAEIFYTQKHGPEAFFVKSFEEVWLEFESSHLFELSIRSWLEIGSELSSII